MPPGWTLAAVVESVTTIAGGGAEIVTRAETDFVLSATAVAVTVTIAGAGRAGGAV
jgi:hypothetical protein